MNAKQRRKARRARARAPKVYTVRSFELTINGVRVEAFEARVTQFPKLPEPKQPLIISVPLSRPV